MLYADIYIKECFLRTHYGLLISGSKKRLNSLLITNLGKALFFKDNVKPGTHLSKAHIITVLINQVKKLYLNTSSSRGVTFYQPHVQVGCFPDLTSSRKLFFLTANEIKLSSHFSPLEARPTNFLLYIPWGRRTHYKTIKGHEPPLFTAQTGQERNTPSPRLWTCFFEGSRVWT